MIDPFLIFADWLAYGLLGLAEGTHAAEAVHFFIYDTLKIVVLLFAMIFVMGIVRTCISGKRVRELIAGKRHGLGNLLASLFGTITPFCSCSSIPIFMGLIEARVPLGVASSFLITSPLVNEYVVVLMLGFFGWEVAASYVIIGVILGTVLGMAIGRFGVEGELVKDVFSKESKDAGCKDFRERAAFGFGEARTIVTKLWIWIMAGVAIGAVIHGYVPEETISSLAESAGILSVPIAVIVGVPVYANCSAVIPIAAVLFDKGAPLGTALAFVMATSALSLPEAIILRRVMRIRLLLLFFGMVTVGIIFIGYLFNLVF